jgi:hypothetical protein
MKNVRKCKILRAAYIGLAVVVLNLGTASTWPQSAPPTSDQTKTDSNAAKKPAETTKKDEKKTPPPSPAPANTGTSATNAKSPAAQKQAPPPASGTVWVNTDSKIYHKAGSRWYGKTKHGKYMTEADAIKAGYHAAAKER